MKLEVKKLIKKFKSTIAVNKISFEIKKNDTLGLLGPNGCGKTTSIGMMLGLITPTEGEIFIDGIKLNSKYIIDHTFFRSKKEHVKKNPKSRRIEVF